MVREWVNVWHYMSDWDVVIGGGLVVDGRIYHGTTSTAGEIGHILVKEDGPRCDSPGITGYILIYIITYLFGNANQIFSASCSSKCKEVKLRNLERLTVETGRVIHRRYMLQRLIQQGQACTVYLAVDQVLQRPVVVKIAPAEHISAYRAAIRSTSQFAHPNIIGIYDLIVEPESVYIVQEYVEGDDFATLLQSQLSPYDVVEMGVQICQALIYAGTPARKICHGDLTPSSIIRDRRGQTRVNNFALPTDIAYFTAWNSIGANNVVVSDPQLPPGQISSGRRSDDTRAVGLLLYQLLAGRTAEATSVAPSADGRLRFMRNVPPEVCDVIARTMIRQHPQYIATPEALYAELKTLADALEPVSVVNATLEEPVRVSPRRTNVLTGQLPGSGARMGSDTALRADAAGTSFVATEQINTAAANDLQAMSGMSAKLTAARMAAYANSSYTPEVQPRRINMPLLLLFGLVLFSLFFGVGYYLSTIFIK
jgi:serine/threonine protein kinase